MKCVVCDRCGKIITRDTMKIGIGVDEDGTIMHLASYDYIQSRDLCEDCVREIVKFIETPAEYEEVIDEDETKTETGQKYDRDWIYKAHKAGARTEAIAKHLGTSKLTIEYIIMKKRQEELNGKQNAEE